MVSKIVALLIAIIFFASTPVYSAVTGFGATGAASYGSGDNTSEAIETPEAFAEIITNLPNMETYLTEETLGNIEGFKSVTLVEEGYSNQEKEYEKKVDHLTEKVDYDNPKKVDGLASEKQTVSHTLEIAFGPTGVYYKVVGTNKTQKTETYQTDHGDYHTTDLVSAELTVIDYDVEVYYAKNTIALRYNKYKTTKYTAEAQRLWSGSGSLADIVWTEKVKDVDPDEYDLEGATLQALEKAVYGKWMVLDTSAEVDEILPPEIPEGQTPTEEQMQELINYYTQLSVRELVVTYSQVQVESFLQAHKNNVQYFQQLASILLDPAQFSEYFEKVSDGLFMVGGMKTNTPDHNRLEKINAFHKAMGIDVIMGEEEETGPSSGKWANSSHTPPNIVLKLDDDTATFIRGGNFYTPSYSASGLSETMKVWTRITIKDVGNTDTKLNNEALKPVYDVFADAFTPVFSGYYAWWQEKENESK